tara:strand:+ start:846 stop:1577 length:732 start_codon:yes stop_codon:yes gene_type:complete
MVKGINHHSNGKQKRLQMLVGSIRSKLKELGNGSSDNKVLIQKIDSVNINQTALSQSPNIQSEHEELLRTALDEATDPSILSIVSEIKSCLGDVTWKQDRSEFYPTSSEVGKRYIESNLHAQLIGPNGSVAKSRDFMLGVFILGPWTLYKDHSHIAPEFYLNLSNKSDWRFNFGPWQRYGAGSLIWNPSNQIHATMVSDKPFLSIFAWLGHVDCFCKVHQSQDHIEIEQQLLQSSDMTQHLKR